MTRQQLTLAALAATTVLAGPASAQTELTLWYHGAGNAVESNILSGLIADFNAAQAEWQITVESFPQESYNDSVVAAALAGNLPCILDVDGPVMPNWAWAGYLQPLPIREDAIAGHLDATVGRWDGQIYAVGLWDAAIALYTRQSTLDALDLRTPTLEDPWTGDEFMQALAAAKASGDYDYALDLGTAWTGEWYPYAFSPFLQSFGGDIVDRSSYATAEGALNGDAAMAFGDWWQSLFTEGYAPGTSQDPASRDNGVHRGQICLLVERQLGGGGDAGRGRGSRRRGVPARPGFRQWPEDRRGLVAIRRLQRLPPSRRRRGLCRTCASGQVPCRIFRRDRPDPGQQGGRADDRKLWRRRAAGGVL